MFMDNRRDHNDDTNGGAIGCLVLFFFGMGALGGVMFIIKCIIDFITGKA